MVTQNPESLWISEYIINYSFLCRRQIKPKIQSSKQREIGTRIQQQRFSFSPRRYVLH
jgi:hypothetical protein